MCGDRVGRTNMEPEPTKHENKT